MWQFHNTHLLQIGLFPNSGSVYCIWCCQKYCLAHFNPPVVSSEKKVMQSIIGPHVFFFLLYDLLNIHTYIHGWLSNYTAFETFVSHLQITEKSGLIIRQNIIQYDVSTTTMIDLAFWNYTTFSWCVLFPIIPGWFLYILLTFLTLFCHVHWCSTSCPSFCSLLSLPFSSALPPAPYSLLSPVFRSTTSWATCWPSM